jgi:hypothetical protein
MKLAFSAASVVMVLFEYMLHLNNNYQLVLRGVLRYSRNIALRGDALNA